MTAILLQARAAADGYYVELRDLRETRLSDQQREDLERAMTFLLRASLAAPIQSEIEVGVAELPWVDGDLDFTGDDPGGRLLLPQLNELLERRKGAAAS